MNTPQEPSLGIMKTGDYTDFDGSRCYTVACSCHDDSHSVQCWIEPSCDEETASVQVAFYATLTNKFWSQSRWRAIWQLLTQGRLELEHHLVISSETAKTLAHVIRDSAIRLEMSQEQQRKG